MITYCDGAEGSRVWIMHPQPAACVELPCCQAVLEVRRRSRAGYSRACCDHLEETSTVAWRTTAQTCQNAQTCQRVRTRDNGVREIESWNAGDDPADPCPEGEWESNNCPPPDAVICTVTNLTTTSECDDTPEALIAAAQGAAQWSVWTEWTPVVRWGGAGFTALVDDPLVELYHGQLSGAFDRQGSFSEIEIEVRVVGARPLRLRFMNDLAEESDIDITPGSQWGASTAGALRSYDAVCIIPL